MGGEYERRFLRCQAGKERRGGRNDETTKGRGAVEGEDETTRRRDDEGMREEDETTSGRDDEGCARRAGARHRPDCRNAQGGRDDRGMAKGEFSNGWKVFGMFLGNKRDKMGNI